MLNTLDSKNFTVFSEANFCFSSGLNVIVGENGAGKSHLLKVIYSVIAASEEQHRKRRFDTISKAQVQRRYAEKLLNVFRPDTLGRLVHRVRGRKRCELQFRFDQPSLNCRFSFATNSKSEVKIEQLPQRLHEKAPVFLPTRELLSIYPGFVSMYENRYLQFDETYRDTCLLLGAAALREPTGKHIAGLLVPLERAMNGKVILDSNDRFYLKSPHKSKMEIPLIAEGVRKLAMIARLISNGSLVDNSYLFWDEPEASLNPRLIRLVAVVICTLAEAGIQVFVTTHSYFLLKEIQIISRQRKQNLTRYFSLVKQDEQVVIEASNNLDTIRSIVALEEELAQFDREQESWDA